MCQRKSVQSEQVRGTTQDAGSERKREASLLGSTSSDLAAFRVTELDFRAVYLSPELGQFGKDPFSPFLGEEFSHRNEVKMEIPSTEEHTHREGEPDSSSSSAAAETYGVTRSRTIFMPN